MRRRYKRKLYLTIILFLFIGIGVGYAFLTSSLNATGHTSASANKWDIHFTNARKNGGTSNSEYSFSNNNTKLNISMALVTPGDYFEAYVDIVNAGTIDARLSEVINTNLTTNQKKYLDYTVTYTYNEPIKEGDLLKAGESDTLRIYIKYKDDTNAKAAAPTTDQNMSFSLQLNYVQDKGTGVPRAKLCHRATTLHTGKTADGNTDLTFGQLGTKETLQSGDAFDCDVNGDGTYDAETERFYYITDLDIDTAVLIYYINTTASGGNASQTTPYCESGENYKGPTTAVNYLPTTWTRVGLKNPRHQITNNSGETTVITLGQTGKYERLYDLPVFNYQTSSRLITYQEYTSISSSSNPYYLYENTPYTNNSSSTYYWLETPHNNGGGSVWVQNNHMSSTYPASPKLTTIGVRPVIEVFKSDMIY